MTEETHSGPAAAAQVGITYRQLDYWAVSGLVVPTVPGEGPGSQRRYAVEDIERLALVKRLLGCGIRLPHIRRILPFLVGLSAEEREARVAAIEWGARVPAGDTSAVPEAPGRASRADAMAAADKRDGAIVAQAKVGVPVQQIANAHDISASAVYKVLQRQGVRPPTQQWAVENDKVDQVAR